MARKKRHQQLFEKAVAAHLRGQLEDAERQYRRLLRDRPRDHEFLHQLGLVRLQQGDLAGALLLLEDAAVLDPTVARYQATLGAAYQADGQIRAARGALERAVALDPASASAWSNLGVLYRLSDRLEEGVAALRRAATLQPDSASIWQNLGAALEQQGDLPAARSALERAAALAPQDAETWCALGKLHDLCGEGRQAEALYRRALLCDRRHAQSWANLAERLRRDGRLEEALSACEQALSADPGMGTAYVTFGLALRDQGHLDPAILTWQRGAASAPTPEALLNLGEAFAERGHRGRSREVLQELTCRFPAYALGWSALGSAHSADAPEEACRCYRRALALDPSLAETRHLLGALEGDPAEVAPAAYVRRLFDDYAVRFDRHLRDELDYRAPELLAALLAGSMTVEGTVVDLGCGTGLLGGLLRPHCARLIGVDLSPGMLARARTRATYDELREEDLVTALRALSSVQLAVAADVFNYLGALEGVFSAAVASSVERLAFTTEHLPEGEAGERDWILRPSGRYAHREGYIRHLAAAYGYGVEAHQRAGLRKERGVWVAGDLFSLRRLPASEADHTG